MKRSLYAIISGFCVILLAASCSPRDPSPAMTLPTLAVLPQVVETVALPTMTPFIISTPNLLPPSVTPLSPPELAASATMTAPPTEPPAPPTEPAQIMNGIELVPFTPRYDLLTQNAQLATELAITREAFADQPAATFIPPPTATPPLAPVTARSMTVYAQGSVNLRECPRRDCAFVGALEDGQSVGVTGETLGETVTVGNSRWYRVRFGGRDAYVYSEIVTDRPPTSVPIYQPPVYVEQPYVPPANTGTGRDFVCPRNCAGARAMGLSPQQAASCPGLDRDKDGVACYGD